MYNINGLSYTTHENPEWFTRALFGGRLIEGGYIRALTGIKGDELLSQIDLENKILQIDGKDCAWTPNQIIKLSEKKAAVKTYKINLEQCIDDLEDKRTLYQLSPGAKNESLPDELEAATLALIAIGLSNEIEELIVAGDESADPNAFNGFQTQVLDSTEAIKIAGATLTAANVLQAIAEAYDAVPEEVLQAEDAETLFALISYKTRRLVRNALAVASNQVLYPMFTLEEGDKRNPRIYYNGLELVPAKGLNNDTIIIYEANNAFFLTDLLSDLEDIEMGQFPAPHDSKVWIKGRLRLGFVIPFEDEVVMWSALVTEDQLPDGNADLRVVPTNLVFDVAGETKTFNIITADPDAEVSVNAAGSGFTATAGATTTVGGFGVTPVTVVSTDNTGSIDPKTGQVLVSIDDSDRSATVMLEQRNSNTVRTIPEGDEGGEEEGGEEEPEG